MYVIVKVMKFLKNSFLFVFWNVYFGVENFYDYVVGVVVVVYENVVVFGVFDCV